MLELYCKAYKVSELRKFPHWTENSANVMKEVTEVDGEEVEVARVLGDDDYLFLHDTFVVTDGMFADEHVIFDNVTRQWIRFCRDELGFAPEAQELPLSDSELAEYIAELDKLTAAAA
jgi:hypothetical protein